MIPYVSTREDRRRVPSDSALPAQLTFLRLLAAVGGRPQGKGESIVQICTLVTVLAGAGRPGPRGNCRRFPGGAAGWR